MNTIESLGIFWTFKSDADIKNSEKYQDEVDGLTFFGYWCESFPEEVIFDTGLFLSQLEEFDAEIKVRRWRGKRSSNCSIDVHIRHWPEEQSWKKTIERSLYWFIERGASIAWCGTEYSSPSLDVFDPNSSAGSVYAALSPQIGFFCNSGLYEEYKDLTSEQLLCFKQSLNHE